MFTTGPATSCVCSHTALWNISARKQATNDKLQGSVATCLGVVGMSTIKLRNVCWQSYIQKRGCRVHFLRLLALWRSWAKRTPIRGVILSLSVDLKCHLAKIMPCWLQPELAHCTQGWCTEVPLAVARLAVGTRRSSSMPSWVSSMRWTATVRPRRFPSTSTV